MGAPGCDDAPLVEVWAGSEAKQITFVYPYYDNPDQLKRQLATWTLYSDAVQLRTNIIVTDDCSPGTAAIDIVREHCSRWDLLLTIKVFRIEKDVRWNWLAAKNIGAYHAAPWHWLMVSDIDHVVSPMVAEALIWGRHDPSIIYRFSRREHTGEKVHPHPNSWFMTRSMFWKVGGYDERMSGYYGSDGYYRRRCAATAPIRIMTDELTRWERIGDSSTTRYLRKQPEDAKLRQIVKGFKPGSLPKTLSFPYHEEFV